MSPDPNDVAAIANRAMRLQEIRDENAADLAELWKEAKSAGHDTNVLKAVVKAIRADAVEDVRTTHDLFDAYVNAIQGRSDAI